MPKWRLDRKYKSEVMSRAAEWSDVLPKSGYLDHAICRIRTKNYSNQYDIAKQNQFEHFTKFKVSGDGKEPLKDMWGSTVLAEYMLNTGKMFPGVLDVMSANYQQIEYILQFGRKPFDGRMALDLEKISETRLGITNDLLTTDYDATDSILLDVDLWFLDDPITPPLGYLQTYEHSTNTWTANSQKKTYKVPTKEKIRRIYLAAESYRSSGTGSPSTKPHRNIRYVKYTHRSGKDVLRDDDLFRNDQDTLWGYPDEIETYGMGEARTGYTFDSLLTRPISVVAVPSYSADPGATSDLVIDQRTERHLTIRRSATAGNQFRWQAKGYGPMSHLCIHEDNPDEPSSYIDPNALKDVEVEVGNSTSGASDGTVRFILNAFKRQ